MGIFLTFFSAVFWSRLLGNLKLAAIERDTFESAAKKIGERSPTDDAQTVCGVERRFEHFDAQLFR